jgi:hypothetical protein
VVAKSASQVRITCWVDPELKAAFEKKYPYHGALTKFIRTWMERQLGRGKETEEMKEFKQIFGE